MIPHGPTAIEINRASSRRRSKHQDPRSREAPNSKFQDPSTVPLRDWILVFGSSLDLGSWCLDLPPWVWVFLDPMLGLCLVSRPAMSLVETAPVLAPARVDGRAARELRSVRFQNHIAPY